MANVVIVGGGIIGCATAYYLAKEGANVTVLERGEIGNEASGAAAGASGAAAGASGAACFSSPPPQVLADKPTSAIAAAAATIRTFLMSSSPFLTFKLRPLKPSAIPAYASFRLLAAAFGAPDRIRTCDLCLRRATLYPAELRVLTLMRWRRIVQ